MFLVIFVLNEANTISKSKDPRTSAGTVVGLQRTCPLVVLLVCAILTLKKHHATSSSTNSNPLSTVLFGAAIFDFVDHSTSVSSGVVLVDDRRGLGSTVRCGSDWYEQTTD
jgi:hypothetical protein